MAPRIITSRHVFDGTHDRSYPAAVVIEGDIRQREKGGLPKVSEAAWEAQGR